MPPQQRRPMKAAVFVSNVREDIRSLNSSILIITQKMKYVVRNEKILGRNLIVLNKKLKALEERIVTGQLGPAASTQMPADFSLNLDEMDQKLAELQAQLQQLSEGAASKEELQEMHYVIDSINPLQFVTIDQAKDLLAGKKVSPREMKRKK